MDFSPENTRNEVLTHALNATLLTFNGNELSLQNDMGNGRVETAYLPEGYMPVGTCEYGGIIYIVSYNPLEDKSQIGCFPSPERNVSNDELGISDLKISRNTFQNFDNEGNPDISGLIKHNTQYVLLKNDNLNPGDKFIVCSNEDIYNEKLADLWVDKDDKHYAGLINPNTFEPVKNPIIALNIVSIEDSGKIVYLNSDIKQYDADVTYSQFNSIYQENQTYTDKYKYHILGKMIENSGVYDQDSIDLDVYRNVLNSGYNVFKSKTSGKLAILAELVMIDSYSVTHSVVPRIGDSGDIVEGQFDIIIHTDITPELNYNNFDIAPKLKYYFLENSQGYIQSQIGTKSLFTQDYVTGAYIYNSEFLGTYLNSIYVNTSLENPLNLNNTLKRTSKFGFPLPKTYHGRMIIYNEDLPETKNLNIYTKFVEGKYHRINYSQIKDNWSYFKSRILANFYYYDSSGQSYTKYTESTLNDNYTYYVRKEDYIYHDVKRNENYKNSDLYILSSPPRTASKQQIQDANIEKFQFQEIHTYKVATNDDIAEGLKLYYTEDGGTTYIQLTGTPVEGVTYYVLKTEQSLVSIGYIINEEEIASGTIYYYPGSKEYAPATPEDIEKYFDFDTYPYKSEPPYGCPITLYSRESNWIYEEATEEQKNDFLIKGSELYYSTDYVLVEQIEYYSKPNQLFIVVQMDTFVDATKFYPNTSYNWIQGKTKPEGTYPKDDPIYLYTLSDFIPTNSDEYDGNYLGYNDVKLASIKLPSVVSMNGLDLPFKYDYTIVPCMNYGKLQHLAVSNTVDFSKLHAFNQSNFNTWKYRIDDNQLRLTFGADIYDTYETYKIDGLILEFYDCWGFAGSIEITDKKSYSGIFTKIIPLNSLKAISRKKVIENTYSESYTHNINITETKNGEYQFNDIRVTYENNIKGWSNISEDNNDCGTIYSNILYGVKAYIRRTTDSGIEFIKKKDFFLYTLPIYNDYYYTIQDFSNLENPELDLMLTYKIQDSSEKTPYNSDNIQNGYTQNDNSNVQSYLGGFYDKSSLDLTRYYKYTGTSELYLEIGLKKEYENLNISYNPEINNYFSCELYLLNDENQPFTVNSGVENLTDVSSILNYNNANINKNVNQLGFGTSYSNRLSIPESNKNFIDSNFITSNGTSPVKINYNFVVGYTVSINNIRNTQVQATTICALFHKTPTGEYNYEDFGVYQQTENEETNLLSNIMFYNEGTAEKEVFGVCRQVKTSGNMSEQCQSITSVETDAQEIKIAGKLNSGEPLKQLVENIGKLTFCQPHVHGLSEDSGVNIHEGDEYPYRYGIPPGDDEKGWPNYGSGKDDESGYGITPRQYLFNNPKYNLCLNTKNSINYNSEFISTLDYNVFDGRVEGTNTASSNETHWVNHKVREYTGFTGDQIALFNQKLIKTMSSVYAYNPDYDSLTVNIGDITLQSYNPSFTSNLLSTKASLNFINETFNDFIYLGPIKYSKYLEFLRLFSESYNGDLIEIKTQDVNGNKITLPQITFMPNYDYCGAKDNYFLISNLTYNTPVPQELEQELEFSSSDIIVIKHSNGENTYLEGIPNKKLLYGYNQEFNKMIQLDVSNYTILNDGTLEMKNDAAKKNIPASIAITSEINKSIFNSSYQFNYNFEDTELKLSLNLGKYGVDSNFASLKYGEEDFFVGIQYQPQETGNFVFKPTLQILSSNNKYNYKYNIKINSIEFDIESILLNDNLSLYEYPIALYQQSYETLDGLISNLPKEISLLNTQGQFITEYNNTYQLQEIINLQCNNQYISNGNNIINVDNQESIQFKLDSIQVSNDLLHIIGLFKIKINRINFTIEQISKLEATPESFISTTKTQQYSKIEESKYKVLSEYQDSCLRGSSITINDLIYEPNIEGHRLYMKNGCCIYNSYLRGKLYYRSYKDEKFSVYSKTKYLNNLFIFTGPCFTESNLL